MTIKEVLKWGEDIALNSGKEQSAIKLLLQHATKKEGYEIIRDFEDKMEENAVSWFKEAVSRYCDGNEPVQYIMGYEYFEGHKVKVNEHVLIPRFETEELVYKILETYDEMFDGAEVRAVDVGTGSGAIACAVTLEESKIKMSASDISGDALEVAKFNSDNLGAGVKFYQGDMLKPLIEAGVKVDILISNPPYIPDEEVVESLVKDNEPHVALFGGSDGLFFYDVILRDACKLLNKRNFIAFEHGFNQGEAIRDLAVKYFPNCQVITYKDMNQKERITIVINK